LQHLIRMSVPPERAQQPEQDMKVMVGILEEEALAPAASAEEENEA